MSVEEKQDRLQRKIDDAMAEGWKLKDHQGDRAVMSRNRGGYGSFWWHLVVLILTVWWTAGLGNIAYAWWYHRKQAQRRVLRGDD